MSLSFGKVNTVIFYIYVYPEPFCMNKMTYKVYFYAKFEFRVLPLFDQMPNKKLKSPACPIIYL